VVAPRGRRGGRGRAGAQERSQGNDRGPMEHEPPYSQPLRAWERAASATPTRDGEGRNRTGDPTVFSRVLYQLSYLARDGKFSP
jgi:hypothetical protein